MLADFTCDGSQAEHPAIAQDIAWQIAGICPARSAMLGGRMRLVSYNILDGGIGRADPIAEILQAQKADVVVLLEADELPVVERVAGRLGMDFVFSGGRKHACALLSRFAIRDSVNYAVLHSDLTNSFTLATLAEPNQRIWRVGAVHLHAKALLADEQVRLQEVERILQLMRPLRTAEMSHILAGDFNANSPIQKIVREKCKTSTQEQMDQNGGTIPRHVITRLLAEGYIDTLHARWGERATEMGSFSTQFPGQRVDYILAHGLAPGQIADAWIEKDRLATYASDHYPVGVEIRE
jgi:endonuclease/exonuclease/phosphatase family metal-dependent hydrolase